MIRHANTPAGPLARAAARVSARTIDRKLIAGAAEHASPALHARAELLSSRRNRESLADSIDLVIAAAGARASRARIAPAREAVLANSANLRALSRRLRAPSPVEPRALASITSLLTDGSGPVFRGDARALAAELADVDAAIATSTQRAYAPAPTIGPRGV